MASLKLHHKTLLSSLKQAKSWIDEARPKLDPLNLTNGQLYKQAVDAYENMNVKITPILA